MTSPTLHKYEVVLMSKDSNGGHEILTVESTKTLAHLNGAFDDHRVWLFSQVMLDKTNIALATAYTPMSYRMADLGRREPVLLGVANIVSIRRATT